MQNKTVLVKSNTVLFQIIFGAGEGSRTPMPKALDPKSSASASSATPAYLE